MKKGKSQTKTVVILFACLVAIVVIARTPTELFGQQEKNVPAVVLADLAKITDNRASQIIENLGYTVSYNTDWHIPNWVAYQLTKAETYGDVPRANTFYADPQAHGVVISTSDYKNSGYDRGHMAPAADMKWSRQAMAESFYLSNVCPQNHNLNGGDWRELEERVRLYAQKYGELFIVCGPIVYENAPTIGYNNIVVPESFFKVLLKKTDAGYEAIGFVFKNQAGNKSLSSYAVSVDSAEKLSGIDFFGFLPDDRENEIEGNFSLASWKVQ